MPTTPTGRYAAYNDLTLAFGIAAVLQWADTEGTKQGLANPQVVNTIQRALDEADAEIIREFIDIGNYTTPLVPLNYDVITVRRWAVTLAGCKLYFLRGQLDETPEGDRYAHQLQTVRNDMARAKTNGGRLDATRRWPVASAVSWG